MGKTKIKFIGGIIYLLILCCIAISDHATPHECAGGVWTWYEIGIVCFSITSIWLGGFLAGKSFKED